MTDMEHAAGWREIREKERAIIEKMARKDRREDLMVACIFGFAALCAIVTPILAIMFAR